MKFEKTIPIATFITCFLTCIAYEAIRINGWYNRFSHYGREDFYEIAFSKGGATSLLAYGLIFMSFIVVIYANNNQKVRYGWFVFSLSMLLIACINIPGAMLYRWGSTSEKFLLFYLLVVPIAAIVSLIVDKRSV